MSQPSQHALSFEDGPETVNAVALQWIKEQLDAQRAGPWGISLRFGLRIDSGARGLGLRWPAGAAM